MKNKDEIRAELKEGFGEAMKSENPDDLVNALTDFAVNIQERVLEDYQAYQKTHDDEILARRGVRQLTTDETKFYDAWIKAVKTRDFRAAFTGLPDAFPETIIDSVMDDIKKTHPLLSLIDFRNTSILTRILVNTEPSQLATWDELGTGITTELNGSIARIDLTLCKLTAYMVVSNDMLDVGPQWLDAYVRATLTEALAYGLEKAIITGTGKNQPIGMDRDVSDSVTVTAGVYPQKTAVDVTEFSPVAIGGLLAQIAVDHKGEARTVGDVILVVNPADYFTKVFPATTVRKADGTYSHDVLPYPVTVVQSAAVAQGEAVFGMAKKYFMGVSVGGSAGKLEYDDSIKFLEDARTYKIKTYGTGRPYDNNAFLRLNISGLKPVNLVVDVNEVKGTVKTKEQTA